MTPKDLRQARPLFEEFAERFTPLLVHDRRTESRRERAKAYLRGLLLDAESTKTAEAIALKVHGDPAQVRMTQVFLGVVVVAMVGNAAEHSSAVMLARKQRMDTALQISVQSSLQVALFVAPQQAMATGGGRAVRPLARRQRWRRRSRSR